MTDQHFPKRKTVIYQLINRLFRTDVQVCSFNGTFEQNGSGKFSDISEKALTELSAAGITHLWCTGIIEHASVTSYPEHGIEGDDPVIVKGIAGSPYAIRDYYDVCPDLADDPANRMFEFESMLKRIHNSGLRLIIDFIPNHLARNYHADAKPLTQQEFGSSDDNSVIFRKDNNFVYLPGTTFTSPVGKAHRYTEVPAKVTGNDVYSANPSMNDWYETVKLNFGIDPHPPHDCHFVPPPDTWLKLLAVVEYWCEKGIDGFRCDMSHMVPVEFWSWLITKIKLKYPQVIFIGEIYEPSSYGLFFDKGCFDFLYDKTGLYDTLISIMRGDSPADQLSNSFNAVASYSERMLSFIENHDELRIASSHCAGHAEAGLPAMTVCAAGSTGPVLVYFGQECGEPAVERMGYGGGNGRTSIFDYGRVPELDKWINDGVFDGGELSKAQKDLRSIYVRLLNICSKEEAFHSGKYYELQYCNRHHQSEGFDEQVHFAWLRYTDDQQMLCIVSFDHTRTADVHIQIPDEALKMMGYHSNDMITFEEQLADSFTTETNYMTLFGSRYGGLKLTMKPNGSRILRLTKAG